MRKKRGVSGGEEKKKLADFSVICELFVVIDIISSTPLKRDERGNKVFPFSFFAQALMCVLNFVRVQEFSRYAHDEG